MELQKFAKAATESTENIEKEITPEEYLEEKVQVQLIKDNDKYKDDVVIGINGEKIMIQRGIPVMIKRKYALILENQYRQQMLAADLQDAFVNQYENNKGSLE